jgi:hypothetical protein
MLSHLVAKIRGLLFPNELVSFEDAIKETSKELGVSLKDAEEMLIDAARNGELEILGIKQ